tara:strand:+ start:1630 stop:1854 length:225 start_codon:yes stop_codon:yes gene_type:complete
MPIQVNFNNGNPIFTPSLAATTTTFTGEAAPLVDLSDVNKVGLNDNDVLVYNESSKTFVPIDIDVINDNDGGVF